MQKWAVCGMWSTNIPELWFLIGPEDG